MSIKLASLALALVAQQAGTSALDEAERIRAGAITKEQAAAALANCGIRRFESSAEGLIDGKMRRTSIRLCAADSESDAEWLAKLEKSAAQVADQPRLPDNVKTKLLAELRAEIERVKSNRPASAALLTGPASGLTAPGLPAPRSGEREPEIAALPPLILKAPERPSEKTAAAARKPALAFRCHSPGNPAGGVACGHMSPETSFIVRAEDDVAPDSLLRFRRGNVQAEVALASGLRRGQTMRVRVPKQICARVFRTEFAVDLVAPGSGQTAALASYGPFTTGC